ncbi:hypothetical protein diail_12345 [Diaporthe ilicicola]|nr:hypothetical protein diail_12345 [Diaporthe ilicicola]
MPSLSTATLIGFAAYLAGTSAAAVLQQPLVTNRTVRLEGYGSFVGTTINQTLSGKALAAPVDAWLGIDYSTQPVGEGRFAPVDWPEAFDGVRPATEYGSACVQDPTFVDVSTQDEACLNFNVFRPQGVPLTEKLPTLVWIHGGAFYGGSWKSFDGASFAAASESPIVVVSFHYRVNSLGFLPSTLFDEEGLLNLGLRDQKLFLQFVQKHIAAFGGDPDQVTIGGRSAGGHSVGIHLFHNYGEDEGKPLFSRVHHQSGSVTARAFPNASYPLYQEQMDEFMSSLGCPLEGDNAASMACLRSADINAIRNISTNLYDKYSLAITWPFQPVQGGPLLEKFGSQSGYDGTFFKVPILTTTVSDEGKYYTIGTLESNQEFLAYMHTISPELNETDIALMDSLYPDPSTDSSSPFANSPNSTQYNRLSAAFSDFAYICPGQETAYRVSTAGAPTWKARFNTNNSYPSWQGIPHTSDTKYTWDEPRVQYPEISHVYHSYLASFVATGDPNTLKYPGSPEWPQYTPSGYGLDSEPALQLLVQPDGTTVEKDEIRREACLYWRDPERAPRLNK